MNFSAAISLRTLLLFTVLPLIAACSDACSDEIGEGMNAEEGMLDAAVSDGGFSDASVSAVDAGRYEIAPANPDDEDGVRQPGEPGYIDVEEFATSCSSSSQCIIVRTDVCVESGTCIETEAVVSDKFGNEIAELRERVYREECPGTLENQSWGNVACLRVPICLEGECTDHEPYRSVDPNVPWYPSRSRRVVSSEAATSVDGYATSCETGAECQLVRRNDCMTCGSTSQYAPKEHWTALQEDAAEEYATAVAQETCEEYSSLPEASCSVEFNLQAVCVEGTCKVREN